ncbi:DUF551 domain-containing protein [Erwinia sp. V71]|uniref:DUF551 domain-containing protein n=1 Tax=Erwinia sp. V71 TaxID=3369424 RepID=UPI003F60E902
MTDWIDCKDNLPPLGVEVQVFIPKRAGLGRCTVTALARFEPYEDAEVWYWDNAHPGTGNTCLPKSVTHWKPMSSPPDTGE